MVLSTQTAGALLTNRIPRRSKMAKASGRRKPMMNKKKTSKGKKGGRRK
jgi:hypothetical protein